MQKDEEFIALLKSTVKENKFDTIPDSELIEAHNRAKLFALNSNELDFELSGAVSVLSGEIKKRGLYQNSKTQDTIPSTGTNQTQFTLISNEHILIDGMSAYMKTSDGGGPHTFALRDGLSGYAYLTNYRLVFCSNAMNSTVAKVFAGGAVGAITRQVFKATKINFQVPISEISSVTKGKEGFSKLLVNTKYKFSTKSGTTYALAFPKGDKWMSIMGTLGIKCID